MAGAVVILALIVVMVLAILRIHIHTMVIESRNGIRSTHILDKDGPWVT